MAGNINLLTATASKLQTQLSNGSITGKQLVKLYLRQISQYDGYLKAVIAVAPEDLLIRTAESLDNERAQGTVRGPLHGIPILIKDNIATDPELGLPTTCGSLALLGSKPRSNAAIIERVSWDLNALIRLNHLTRRPSSSPRAPSFSERPTCR
jgi:amidase